MGGMLLIHLPKGPSKAIFSITDAKISKHIRGSGRASKQNPELILKNFKTKLGRRIGHMFASLFHQHPQLEGRKIVTFLNKRDFIFFRHHRYMFCEVEQKNYSFTYQTKRPIKNFTSHIQELGPRFTLKLISLHEGVLSLS